MLVAELAGEVDRIERNHSRRTSYGLRGELVGDDADPQLFQALPVARKRPVVLVRTFMDMSDVVPEIPPLAFIDNPQPPGLPLSDPEFGVLNQSLQRIGQRLGVAR
ncbi:hypothetical protein M3D05_06140, partial [Kocuria rhizophila]|uniref:hypothetical protein n=1 Tax=Kocuria rhizophila TaxID=72000 RepID=UPI0021A3EF3C